MGHPHLLCKQHVEIQEVWPANNPIGLHKLYADSEGKAYLLEVVCRVLDEADCTVHVERRSSAAVGTVEFCEGKFVIVSAKTDKKTSASFPHRVDYYKHLCSYLHPDVSAISECLLTHKTYKMKTKL